MGKNGDVAGAVLVSGGTIAYALFAVTDTDMIIPGFVLVAAAVVFGWLFFWLS